MVDDWVIKTMYATKRRRRSIKSVKTPMKDPPKSNPSKRHRERLNSELDHIASLLPFEQSVISKLDKLSVLRLSVSYLRTKSYFQAVLHERYGGHVGHCHNSLYHSEPTFSESENVLQALSGFLFVVTLNGEVFFASRTVEQYLGFHQSDIIHQSALELIHSEDREEFKNQLNWRSQLPQDRQDMTFQEVMLPENSHLLYRCFTVRFRCLLDNTSGFITLEISGHIRPVLGQSLKGEEPPLALFALCCPFGPLPLLDMPPRDYTFKTKHKMDLAPLSMDHRGKLLFGYSDRDLLEKGGYDLIHPDDLSYYAAAHQELIKTGSSGLIAYRLLTKDMRWVWLQTSSKVVYKNSKPDFVICTHRHLTDDEGRDLLGKRGTEFKLPYPLIDTDTSGLASPIEDEISPKVKTQRIKKSKTQLREYLHTGRKRKTSYRDAFNGLNCYNPYPALNGYPACQAADIKTDIMYPYASNNYTLDTDLYRQYHTFASSVYPATADTYRLDADKHAYTNGYYLEPRQYQHTLQYHGNGYTDLVTQSTKYGYDMAKYGYDMNSYGLDLSKQRQYEEELSKYETDIRKYDYTTDKLGHRVNGCIDSLKTNTLYNSSAILNNNSLINNPIVSAANPVLYQTESMTTPKYEQHVEPLMKDSKIMKLTSDIQTDDPKLMHNGHGTVIRNASPRTKSTRNTNTDRQSCSGNSIYSSEGASSISPCNNSTWSPCSKAANQCKSSPRSTPSDQSCVSVRSPQISNLEVSSRIISPSSASKNEAAIALNSASLVHSNASPTSATTATSVIQQSGRHRSCDKQQPITGGIAVPVVKSSSWLHHLPSTYSDWHITSSDSYSCHQRTAYTPADSVHSRTMPEGPKMHTAIGEAILHY